jgi:hypothetical protein
MIKTDFEKYCETLDPLWNTHISRTYAEQFFYAGKATHPMRELSDEEIMDAWKKFPNWGHEQHIVMFGRELIKKAREK